MEFKLNIYFGKETESFLQCSYSWAESMGFPPPLRAGTETFSSLNSLKDRKCVCLRVQSLTEKLNTVLLGKGDLLSAA